MGYSYNGYYARLLICEIRVRIPDDSKTPHRTNGSGRHILNVKIRVRLPTGLLKCFDISYCRVAR